VHSVFWQVVRFGGGLRSRENERPEVIEISEKLVTAHHRISDAA
jgi:hypothetical protein